jgi:PBP4 family serine-type D-alanyl-D-alanine carboxypeptidase
MNKPSDNFYAEMLTKGLGAQFAGGGTTARGVKAEGAFLISVGVPAKTFRLTDGSGLSYYDRLTTLDITTLLTAMSQRSDWKAFWYSLSVAGVDGTLAHRMRGTVAKGNLHGKTGTLDNASNLSGYVLSANGEWLVFSLLMNKKAINVSAAHAAQDAIGVALARSRPGGKVVWSPNPTP